MSKEFINKNLKIRFETFKNYIINNNFKFGDYWENAKKTFDVDYVEGNYYSKGIRNYLPLIYDFHKYDKKNLIKIFENDYIKIGNKKLCTTTNLGNSALIHCVNYYRLLQKYFGTNIVTCEIGSGSGLLQFILHHYKKNKSILIDIPEVMINSVALCFTLFPNARVLLPNEILDDTLDIDGYDFIFLFPSQKNLIKKNSVDFCFNTQSFMEMENKEINEYIQLFNLILKNNGYCFISNRVLKISYFFSYNFKNTQFKKIFLHIDDYFNNSYKNLSLLNLLLKRDHTKNFYFNIYDYLTGILYLKNNELYYWFKVYLKRILRKLIK